jgi:exodeoxyribonuclease-3
MPLHIISYNLNGIRSALSKGLGEWIQQHGFDIICIQETKAQPEQINHGLFEALGYHDYWHSAEKKGYSGVLTLSKQKPDKVVAGCGEPRFDSEGRILRTDFGDLTLLNCYFPSGTTGDVRQAVKMEFLDFFFDWVQRTAQGKAQPHHRRRLQHRPQRDRYPQPFRQQGLLRLPARRAGLDDEVVR